jgi:hypothetical protein
MTHRTVETGLAGAVLGYLVGERRGRRRAPHRLAWAALGLVAVGYVAVVVIAAWWPWLLGAAVLLTGALVWRHHRHHRHADELERAYAEGYAQGQREAHRVERSWRSVPARDPEDPEAF